MFLDPEPRTSRRPQSQNGPQAFIPPLASPTDQRIVRKPLTDRSPNHALQKYVEDEEAKPTVRLVRTTPSVASIRKEVFGEPVDKALFKEKWKSSRYTDLRASSETSVWISEPQSPTVDAHDVDSSIDVSLRSALSEELPPWKRNISSGNFSQATTLKGGESAGSAYARSDRMSSGTTARELSTFHDTSLEDLPESIEEAGPLDDTDCSETTYDYEESIAEQQSIKPAHPSIRSHDTELPQAETPRPRSRQHTWSSPASEYVGSSSPADGTKYAPAIPRRISSKRASASSFPLISSTHASTSSFPLIRPRNPSPDASVSPRGVWSVSPVQSEASEPAASTFASSPNFAAYPSSPNLIAYDTSPTRPRSRSHPLRGETSWDSITSRMQDEQPRRLSLAHSISWSSIDPTSSHDTLPSLHVPRRRLRQARGSQSLDLNHQQHESGTSVSREMLPYPRNGYSGNLSTIASESERSRSRTMSQQPGLSSFQNESMVLPGDSSRRRLDSVASQAIPDAYYQAPEWSSEDEPGDMTLGVYREESAMPAPLFRAPSPVYQVPSWKMNGPLPPLPPIPHDEEGHDTLAELGHPELRLKRSGYSLRHQKSSNSLRHQQSSNSLRHQRSNSTPVLSQQISFVSCSESERWSTGSNIFPAWARLFYAGHTALASMSRTSLYSMPSPPTRDGAQDGFRFGRSSDIGFQRDISSPPGTAMTLAESRVPRSRFAIQAILRPRARTQKITAADDNGSPQAQIVRVGSSERDTMAIEPATVQTTTNETYLPSGQPKHGKLKSSSYSAEQALPRDHSTDKDEQSGMATPHLALTKRSSAHISAWRPPSFVESLDLMLKSRGPRQILFFLVGFICPFSWMIGAVMPLPPRPFDTENGHGSDSTGAVKQRYEAGEAAQEKAWRQGVWWRNVNRVMSIVGLFIIGGVIAIAVVATH